MRKPVFSKKTLLEKIPAKIGKLLMFMISLKDKVVLKKINKHSQETLIRDLRKMAKEGRKRLEARGIRENDIPEIVHKSRRR